MSAINQERNTTGEHFDVLIVGAGISGIGAAHHLLEKCPRKSFVILENKESFGGTWRQHTYPGIRSDSDLYTFGYRFKPWVDKPIATADKILAYMGEVIDENAFTRMLRAGELAGAGLDVFEKGEEINPRLRGLDNVMLLPHMGSATNEGRLEMGEKVIINIKTFADGHRPPDLVVPGVL